MGKHKKYSTSLKLQAVKTFLKGEKSASVIAEELGISSRRRLTQWATIYEKYGEQGFKDKRGKLTGPTKGRPKKDFDSLEEENEFLRAKVALLEALAEHRVKKK
ncbi:MAG: helix-turn-helix domain-containing protein [Candidatus Delongbacteria bacterium]|jgi:transposase|nr:helix-turn-helix domain-containing protein [Candidatus Delongbacteria bacterium]